MRFPTFAAAFLAVIIAVTLLVGVLSQSKNEPDVYVGIYAGSTDFGDLTALADQVKDYTNLFVVGSFGITWNLDKLTSICQRLDAVGLNFMVFQHPEDIPFAQWVTDAQHDWGSRFLGLYAYDETGGHQIDKTAFMAVHADQASTYAEAASVYVSNVTDWLQQLTEYSGQRLPMYASDYVLYDCDYRAGYDGIFTQFGWNFSRTLHIALCRGAATMHNKPWGAIVTWTYDVPPYLESGQQMFEDMVNAYNNGAKYILAFDYDKNTTRGILQPEHLQALKDFWTYSQTHPRNPSTPTERVAYVLPADYGFGFRSAADTLWGLWPADDLSASIWSMANHLAQQYGENLDIVYLDSLQHSNVKYGKLVFWNGTQIPE
jgi:hypothetical protein